MGDECEQCIDGRAGREGKGKIIPNSSYTSVNTLGRDQKSPNTKLPPPKKLN